MTRRRSASVARAVLLVGSVLALAGCDVLGQADIIRNLRKEPNGAEIASPLTEQGYGKLAKGELIAAHSLFDQALKANPADVHALMGKGMILQRWNEPTPARQAYQAVLALKPDDSVKMMVAGSPDPQPVVQIAAANLAMLPGGDDQPSSPNGAVAQPMAAPANSVMRATPNTVRTVAAQQYLSDGDVNTMARFETLAKLRDQALITPDEYAERRKANIGALLPLTNPTPASTGLDRPVPAAEQIVGRLNAINRALEMRAINMRQHQVERTTIIDGLLPSTPRVIMNPALPPKGLIEAADSVRRLEVMKEKGIISNDEYTKEKEAVERTLSPPAPPRPAQTAATATAVPQTPVGAAPLGGGPRPAVHIASYRSEDAATKGWAQLRRAYPQLANLQPEVSRVNLGAQKGVYYRLMAGPLVSQADAERICRELKAKRQFCEVAFMSGGGAAVRVAPAPPAPAPRREPIDDSGN